MWAWIFEQVRMWCTFVPSLACALVRPSRSLRVCRHRFAASGVPGVPWMDLSRMLPAPPRMHLPEIIRSAHISIRWPFKKCKVPSAKVSMCFILP